MLLFALMWNLLLAESNVPVAGAEVPTPSAIHPFYVSVTEIRYNPEAQRLEGACKLFVNDLDDALSARYDRPLHLGLSDEDPDADVYLALYFQDQLGIQVNAQKSKTGFLGKEFVEEVVWCYFEIPAPTLPQTIEVRNALLTEQFDGQRNMVHVTVGETTRSLLLHKQELSGVCTF